MVSSETDNSVCHPHPRDPECERRKGIQVSPGLLRLEDLPSSVPEPSEPLGPSGTRPVCLPVDKSATSLCELETSEAVDAFSLQWNIVKGYAFPHFCLLGRCLSQVLRQQVPCLVLVAPVWKSQPWYPLLLDLLVDFPVLIPQSPNLITREGVSHPLTHLQLGGWLISGNSMRREAFHAKLESSSQQVGGKTPPTSMLLHGESGLAGALRGKLIPFQHL